MLNIYAKLCGRVVRKLGPGSKDARVRFECCARSLYLHMFTSAAQLVYQMLSGVWIACDSCTKNKFGSFEKCKGNLAGPRFPILAEVRITWPQWCPIAVIYIRLIERMQTNHARGPQFKLAAGMES
jgi:hypothetical protein